MLHQNKRNKIFQSHTTIKTTHDFIKNLKFHADKYETIPQF